MKNRFYGKYYKFISDSGRAFACIASHANEGDMLQIITEGGSFLIPDTSAFRATDESAAFDVRTDGLTLSGSIRFGEFHPLKKRVMGPFDFFPLECRHHISSMYHTLTGELVFNGERLTFTGSPGYIEGDSGKNFPSRYIWYNSVTPECTVTLAIATIPVMGIFDFTGLLCFIRTPDAEYRLCTYNRAKPAAISREKIVLKKGGAVFTLRIKDGDGFDLKAPVKGNMSRCIKECITIETEFELTEKGKRIVGGSDPISSFEYVWEE